MSEQLLSSVVEQSQSLLAPVVKANKLAVANLEKLVDFQMKVLPSYVDLGLGQLKAAVEVNDVKSLQGFVEGQLEVANTLRQKLMDDAKALADLGATFKVEFDKLAEESFSALAPKTAKSAPRKAA